MAEVNGAKAIDLAAIQSPDQLENTAEQLANAIATALAAPEVQADLSYSVMLAQTLALIAISKRLDRFTTVVKHKR